MDSMEQGERILCIVGAMQVREMWQGMVSSNRYRWNYEAEDVP